jgi:glycosyltransferase involved in cell wall biosynthesis
MNIEKQTIQVHPAISIIVPIYNGGKYLMNCLLTLCGQNFKNIEIICIDDGSTDNTVAIINAFIHAEPRIRLFQQVHKGTGSARNVGIAHSRGEYIMFCDCDDEYTEITCKKMFKAIRKTKADIVKCRMVIVAETGRELHAPSVPKSDRDTLHDFSYFNQRLLGREIWDKIFKREIIENYGIRFPDTVLAEDSAFLVQYESVCRSCAFINDELGLHNQHKGSVLAQNENTGKYFKDAIKSTLFAIDFLVQHKCVDKNLILLDFLTNDIMSVAGTSIEGCRPYFDMVKAEILQHFDASALADFPMLKAIKENNYDYAVRVLRGNTAALMGGFFLPPGAVMLEKKL